MSSTRLIRRRIKSAKNIAQITKAMEMVAAAKMRKAQNIALAGKPYAEKIYQAVFELAKRCDVKEHPLLLKNIGSEKKLAVLITTNKGLCGGLNTNLLRAVSRFFKEKNSCDFITVGKKGENFVVRTERKLVASFGQTGSFSNQAGAVINLVISEYLSQKYQEFFLIYNNFITALKLEPTLKKLLPLGVVEEDESLPKTDFSEFIVEPNYDQLFEALIPHYLENQLRSAIYEAEASEHSARMMAMKNATDNALELMTELTLAYNKVRQEKITYEIADMVTARMAVE
ncbi:ATP synthase F1 subunit gamma [Candidatus Gottesmanbacteria bacterium]|nr:ATP synthase F1 subunit gamma [Candidatus Gottesmanbacteria bacterium]